MRHRAGDEVPEPFGSGGGEGFGIADPGGPWHGGGTRRTGGVRGRHGARSGRRPYAREEAQDHLSAADLPPVAGPGVQTPQTARQHRAGPWGDGDAVSAAEPYPGGGYGPAPDPAYDDPEPDPDHDGPPYDDPGEDEQVPRRRRGGGLLVALLAIVAAGLATALTLSLLELRALRRGEAAGSEALAAARTYAFDMLSYDHRHIEQDLARARGHATERLAGHYRRLAETLIPQVRREQTIQQVTVAGAAVESATPERVRVLMLVNLTTSKLPPGARSRRDEVSQGRVRFVMIKGGDGAWRVDELSTLLGDPPTRT